MFYGGLCLIIVLYIYTLFCCHQVILLCSAWCCVVTHSIQLFVCISSDFFHNEAKVLPLCTYLTIVIKSLTDLVLIHL